MKIQELLTKKYAGLPGWSWLIIGAAGIGLGVFLMRRKTSTTAPADLTAQSTPDLTTGNEPGAQSNEAGTIGDGGTINNPFPETNVNGSQVPIIPPGYQAIYDNNGNIIGFEPIPPSNTSTGGSTGSGNSGSGSSIITYITTRGGASLETTPHDIDGGKNILSLPLGAILTYISGPVADPLGQGKQYYLVSYNGKTGYVGSDVIQRQEPGPGRSGPPIAPLSPATPQALVPTRR